MAGIDVQMDYEGMEAMAKAFEQGAQAMDQAKGRLKQMAGRLNDNGLKGKSGEALADAIQTRAIPALDRLGNKLNEEARDVRSALKDMQDGVSNARGKFA
jgi:WXG100 family type VII secretion target